jgi:hypothetical protein
MSGIKLEQEEYIPASKMRICRGKSKECLKKFIVSRDSVIEGEQQKYCLKCLHDLKLNKQFKYKKPTKNIKI